MVLSTAISDGVLALLSLALARSLVAAAATSATPAVGRSLRAAAVGLGLVGAAALCGAVRFAGLAGLAGAHRLLTDAATAIGMPAIGAAALALAWSLEWSARAHARGLLGLVALFALARVAGVHGLHGLVIGGLGTGGALAAGARGLARSRRGGALLIAGAIGVLVAGLVVGAEGELGPVRRIDVFHYLLALSNLALAGGLLRLARAR